MECPEPYRDNPHEPNGFAGGMHTRPKVGTNSSVTNSHTVEASLGICVFKYRDSLQVK